MGAPIGNKFAAGLTNSGKPPIIKSPEELQKKITAYFANEEGKYTITGLCLSLGFESRQSFYDYEKKKEYSYLVKRARMVIESYYEERLQCTTPAGSIFALKNMGWSDKSEIEHSGLPTPSLNVTVDSSETAKTLKELRDVINRDRS